VLAFLIGLLVAVGPVLRGGWDLWASSLLFLAVAGGTAAWLVSRAIIGYAPLPSKGVLLWTGALAALSLASALLSPVSAYALPAWRSLVLGLWIFPALELVSKDGRARIDQAVRAASWVLVLLAFYQKFHEGMPRPPGSFLNQNVFAGTILMLLPLAVQREDWPLSGGLVFALLWTRSAGAWLGLGAVIVLTSRPGSVWRRVGAGIGLVCLVALVGRLGDPDTLHRWHWWVSAARLSFRRPLLGYGPGSFAYALPSAREPGANLNSLYAHQYFLETAAECGLPYLLIFTAGLLARLRRDDAPKRFGALAILIQSCWDYALSIPANFWLFCYLAASSTPQTSEGVEARSSRKPLWAALFAAAGWLICSWALTRWRADYLKARAVESYQAGASAEIVLSDLERAAALAPDPEAERYIAELELSRGRPAAAVERLERSARLDPFRASTRAALERLKLQLGRPAQEIP
jgi:hypothetical protein